MTKQEWEEAYHRLSRDYEILEGNKFEIQNQIREIVNTLNSGLYEENDYFHGVKDTLKILVPLLNKGLRLKIPELKPEKVCKVMIFKGGKGE